MWCPFYDGSQPMVTFPTTGDVTQLWIKWRNMVWCQFVSWQEQYIDYRGPAPFHRLTPNKRFEPVFSTVIMAVCSLFNRMLLLTDLIPVHLLYCGQTVMIGCNHTSFEWTRAVRHIYGIIRHMQGLYINLALVLISNQEFSRGWGGSSPHLAKID